MTRAALLVGLVAVGCATAGDPAESRTDDRTCVEGLVASTGTDFAPRTFVRSSGGEEVELRGGQTSNVRLLTGAVVLVCGQRESGSQTLTPGRVQLRSVDGLTAHIGVTRDLGDHVVLEPLHGGEPIPLSSVPPRIRSATDVLWVSGRDGPDGTFEVVSFGVLRGWQR